jgi:hypothetical protein
MTEITCTKQASRQLFSIPIEKRDSLLYGRCYEGYAVPEGIDKPQSWLLIAAMGGIPVKQQRLIPVLIGHSMARHDAEGYTGFLDDEEYQSKDDMLAKGRYTFDSAKNKLVKTKDQKPEGGVIYVAEGPYYTTPTLHISTGLSGDKRQLELCFNTAPNSEKCNAIFLEKTIGMTTELVNATMDDIIYIGGKIGAIGYEIDAGMERLGIWAEAMKDACSPLAIAGMKKKEEVRVMGYFKQVIDLLRRIEDTSNALTEPIKELEVLTPINPNVTEDNNTAKLKVLERKKKQ